MLRHGAACWRQVLIDVNWRPVFWEDPDHAKDAIMPYLGKADIVKVSDEEVEWLLGVPAADALFNPEKVRAWFTDTNTPACTEALLRTGAPCTKWGGQDDGGRFTRAEHAAMIPGCSWRFQAAPGCMGFRKPDTRSSRCWGSCRGRRACW